MVITATKFDVELHNVTKKFGSVTAVDNITLQIRDGEFFSLLGPSGCGKTTSLRMIAGFELPTSGEIIIAGKSQGYLPPHYRPVNTVFQQYALFPHLNVYQNVAFGLEMQKFPQAEIINRVGKALDLVHLTGMDHRRPKQLSGGQQQRVALARALINHPQVLLLDEPLGALDLKLRKAMQIELKTLQEEVGITFIYVTHDQEEALTMSDRIAVMNLGKILQVGTSTEIYENPTTRFVADFIGETNLLPGTLAQNSQVDLVSGGRLRASWVEDGLMTGDSVVISVRPEKIHIHPKDAVPEHSQETNQLLGIVENIIYRGVQTGYLVRTEGGLQLSVHVQNTGMNPFTFTWDDPVVLTWAVDHARALRA